MAAEKDRRPGGSAADTEALAIEAAFRAVLPGDSIPAAMALWREHRGSGTRVSLRPLAEQVAERLERPNLADRLYVELLRCSFQRRPAVAGGESAGSGAAAGASSGAEASAPAQPLRELVNALVLRLSRSDAPTVAGQLLDEALHAEFPESRAAQEYRHWLAGGRLPDPPPDEPTGRSLVNRLWGAACHALGPAEADRALAEAVYAAERPHQNPELGPRRYL